MLQLLLLFNWLLRTDLSTLDSFVSLHFLQTTMSGKHRRQRYIKHAYCVAKSTLCSLYISLVFIALTVRLCCCNENTVRLVCLFSRYTTPPLLIVRLLHMLYRGTFFLHFGDTLNESHSAHQWHWCWCSYQWLSSVMNGWHSYRLSDIEEFNLLIVTTGIGSHLYKWGSGITLVPPIKTWDSCWVNWLFSGKSTIVI